jgi:hypothetical protein
VTPARLLILCLWGIIVLLVIPLYVNMAWADPVDYPRGGLGARDFKAFYIGARLLARGADPYDEGAQQAEMDALGLPRDRTFYIYPTALALALVPLANVPLETAARVWNTLNLVLLAGGLALVARAYRFDVRGSVLPTFVLGTALAYPTILSLRMGQSNILVLFFLVVVYFGNHRADVAGDSDFRSLQRLWKSSRMPGAALAVAGVVKIIPLGLFAYFLWTRKYRAAAWGMVGFAILLGASAVLLALLGQNPLLDFEYFARVLPSLTVADARIGNQSLNGFVSRVLSASGATGVVIALVSVAMVGATFAVIGRGVEDDYGFGLVLTLLARREYFVGEHASVAGRAVRATDARME